MNGKDKYFFCKFPQNGIYKSELLRKMQILYKSNIFQEIMLVRLCLVAVFCDKKIYSYVHSTIFCRFRLNNFAPTYY